MVSRLSSILAVLLCHALCVSANSHQQLVVSSRTDLTDRAAYVKEILSRRLTHVESGKRMRDFARFVNGGNSVIYSMHGLDQNKTADNDEIPDYHPHVPVQPRPLKGDPFPTDRLNLDLYTSPGSPEGKQVVEKAVKPPNVFQLAVRACTLAWRFTPAVSTFGLAMLSQTFRQKYWYPWLTDCIARSGAAWIKWGQWSSTRHDMFPSALCDSLSTLHASAPAHKWSISERTIEESLGLESGTVLKVFDSFDEQPLASGSIAQVHKAVLNGQTVAVKIRHPRVAELMELDFRLMSIAATLFDYIPALSWLHIRESVDQFSHTMAAQSYLNVEAHHLEVLNHNFRTWPHVRFPQPFYASSSVIMETFETGKIITDVLDSYDELAVDVNGGSSSVVRIQDADGTTEIDGHDLIPVEMAKFMVTSGVALYLKMLLVDNLMHADLQYVSF